jgi:hypothetical protein
MDGLKMGWSIRIPVLTMALGFTLLFTLLLVIRMRAALLERKIRALRVLETEAVPNDYSFVAPEVSA